MKFCEFSEKQVINIADCRCIGNVVDLEIDECNGCICSLLVADTGCFRGIFHGGKDFCVPWDRIVKIGPDIILVDVCMKPHGKESMKQNC